MKLIGFVFLFSIFLPTPRSAASKSLIYGNSTDAEATKIISKYLDPKPGQDLLLFEPDLRERPTKDSMNLRGFIRVTPPKGYCFKITRNIYKDDVDICTEKLLSWTVSDLGADGSIRWKISTGPDDFGRTYVWNSNYRIAQTIALNESKTYKATMNLITSCESTINSDGTSTTKIYLHRNRIWMIDFPAKHIAYFEPHGDKAKSASEKKPEAGHGSENKSHETPKDEHAKKEKPKTSVSISPTPTIKPATEIWNIPQENSYVLNSKFFKTRDGTTTDKGICRYQPTGASEDKTMAWIECHHTASFDVVFAHLTCPIHGIFPKPN